MMNDEMKPLGARLEQYYSGAVHSGGWRLRLGTLHRFGWSLSPVRLCKDRRIAPVLPNPRYLGVAPCPRRSSRTFRRRTSWPEWSIAPQTTKP